MKVVITITIVILLFGCKNKNPDPQTVSKSDTIHQAPSSDAIIALSDTGSNQPSLATPNQSVFPPGTFSSLKDLMQNCFSTGSTRKEVLVVQGQPDYTESNPPLENWYYGESVVQFKGQLVGSVTKRSKTLKYVDYFELALSSDKIVGEFYTLLNTRINR